MINNVEEIYTDMANW